MPSPIGHALGGLIVGLLMPSKAEGGRQKAEPIAPLWPIVLASVVPDLDFAWGRHNAETHSLGAAVFAGLAVLAWKRGRQPMLALAVTLAWSSHVLFDWLGSDDTPPLGVMALWPISKEYFFAHAYIFEAISRRYWLANFWPHNLYAVATELLMLGPIAFLAWKFRRAR